MTILTDLILVLALSALVVFFLQKLRVPTVVGFILSGVLLGPHLLGLIREAPRVEAISQIGIVLLMFCIGLEFSISRLRQIRGMALGGGMLQVGVSILAGILVAAFMQWPIYLGAFLGCVISLSSTAIVLKSLMDRGELDSAHGRISLGILIFQDLSVVPMIIFLTMLGKPTANLTQTFLIALLKSSAFLAGTWAVARYLLPTFLFQVAKTRSKELFLIAVIVLCLGLAWFSERMGLSLALGAFLAGLVLSDTEYSNQILSDMFPFRDLFLSLFFVSVGMLLDLGFVVHWWWLVLLVSTIVLVVNFHIGTLVVLLFGFPLRVALLTGLALCQIGEFSFILAQIGRRMDLIGEFLYQLTLATIVLTLLLTPLLIHYAPGLAAVLEKFRPLRRFRTGHRPQDLAQKGRTLSDHVVICGFGPIGQMLSALLQQHQVPYLVLELNPKTVRENRKRGIPIFFGDATSEEILKRCRIERAQMLVSTVPDMISARALVRKARGLNGDLVIVVRIQYETEVEELMRLGADSVVLQELETGLELVARVLEICNVSPETIQEAVRRERLARYGSSFTSLLVSQTHGVGSVRKGAKPHAKEREKT